MQTNMNLVESSIIAAIGYDGLAKILHVQFKTGLTYLYFNVPINVYDEIFTAPSQGSYFSKNIRGKYTYVLESEVKHA